MKALQIIKIIKNTYDPSHPLFNGNLQIEDYSGRYMPASVCLTVDLDAKTAQIEDWGAYIPKSSTCTAREWEGRLFHFFAPIRFISRRDLASLLLSLRPLLKEAFEGDAINGLLADEIQGLLDGEIYYCCDAEQEEIDRQCQAACEECGFVSKLNPDWIIANCFYDGGFDCEEIVNQACSGTEANSDLILSQCRETIYPVLREAEREYERRKFSVCGKMTPK